MGMFEPLVNNLAANAANPTVSQKNIQRRNGLNNWGAPYCGRCFAAGLFHRIAATTLANSHSGMKALGRQYLLAAIAQPRSYILIWAFYNATIGNEPLYFRGFLRIGRRAARIKTRPQFNALKTGGALGACYNPSGDP